MAKVVEFLASKPQFSFPIKDVQQIGAGYGGLRRTKLTNLSTERSYFFSGFLAKLEQALISYTTSILKLRGFEYVSVPDILQPEILEGCGMLKPGEHSMVYFLDPKRHGRYSLSGTSEMALAAMWRNKRIDNTNLPIRQSAVSRCYRAEVSDIQEGIYRVHEFTKVEMFGICRPADSDHLHNEFLGIQVNIVNSLGLHAQVLEMPKEDLGLNATKKFDIEAWMPGQDRFGEITSTSNCTDYQTRRLNIGRGLKDAESGEDDGKSSLHTVNGTACAIPRMIIALLEQHQTENGDVIIPGVLRRYFGGVDKVEKPKDAAALRWRKKRKITKES